MRALPTALLGVAVVAAPALAQRAPEYDPNAVVTVTGVVVDLHEAKKRNDHPGLHFILDITPAPADAPEAAKAEATKPPLAGEAAAAEPQAPAVPAPAAEPEPGAPAAPEPGAPAAPEPGTPAAPEPSVAAAPGAADEPEVAPEPAPPPAERETVEVHACPMDLLGYLDFKVEPGDELTVTGSRPGDGSIIVAREIVKGTVKLQVRDPKGVPIWTDLR